MVRVARHMTSTVHSVRADDSMSHAARVMWDGDCGALPVEDDEGRLAGIVTDRDLFMSAAIEGRSLHELAVRQAMLGTVVTCRPDDELPVARDLMARHRLRRLPVVDDDGRVCGMITLSDLVREALPFSTRTRRQRADELLALLGDVLRPASRADGDGLPADEVPARRRSTTKRTRPRPAGSKTTAKKAASARRTGSKGKGKGKGRQTVKRTASRGGGRSTAGGTRRGGKAAAPKGKRVVKRAGRGRSAAG